MTHMDYAISASGLSKRYGQKYAVDHVDMHVPMGSIYGFVGENGSGKTTIMRLLMGLARQTSGSYSLFGVDYKNKGIYAIRNKISAIVEAPSLVPTMNAIDNLRYAAMYYGFKKSDEEIKEVIHQVGLADTGNKVVKNFSLGMKQRLGIAVLLLNDPTLLLLDEPMNGLDPQGIAELRDLMLELNSKGITILISSHILSELEKVATHWGFISHGKILEEISHEDLLAKCSKFIEIRNKDIMKMSDALHKLNINDFIISQSEIFRIYQDDVNLTDLLVGLRKEGIEVDNIRTSEVDVEDYYLSLISGGVR